jgi:hypothetical protein
MRNEWTKYNECDRAKQRNDLHRDIDAVPQETRRTPLEDSYVFASICTQKASTIIVLLFHDLGAILFGQSLIDPAAFRRGEFQ